MSVLEAELTCDSCGYKTDRIKIIDLHCYLNKTCQDCNHILLDKKEFNTIKSTISLLDRLEKTEITGSNESHPFNIEISKG